jgi:HK97 gp10 family phage protein
MPDGISVEIKGLADLQRKLDALATSTAERCIRTALKAGAEVEKAAIEERIPARPDLPSRTALPIAALKSDISIQMKRSDQGNISAIVGPGEATAHVAEWVEEGHRLVRGGYSREVFKGGEATGKYRGPGHQVTDDDGELINVQPHPYIREAYEATRDEATQAIITVLGSEIEKAAK